MTDQQPANLISADPILPASDDGMERAMANLMLNIRHGNPLQIRRLPNSSLYQAQPTSRAAYVALDWTDPAGQPRYIVSVNATGQYWAENPPPDGPAIKDRYSVFDKILDAVNYHYDIRTFVDDQGSAVLTWDRASHGNCPAVVLTAEDLILTYYHAPLGIRSRLHQSQQERYSTEPVRV